METRKKQLIYWIFGLYIMWWLGLLVSTFLFVDEYIIIGDIIYFAVICIVGIIIPYHLFNKFKIGWKELPKNMTLGFLISSLVLIVVAFGAGIYLMGGIGNGLPNFEYLAEVETLKIINLILILVPTSLAYAVFFYGFVQEAWEYILDKSRSKIFLAVLFTSLMFGLTHMGFVEDWSNIKLALLEVLIMTFLSMCLGLYFHYFNSIFFVYIAFLTIKWFISVPSEVIHRDFPVSLTGVAVLLISFILYYLFIGRKGPLKKLKLKFKFNDQT